MLTAGRMTEQVQVYRKNVSSTSPEAWVKEGRQRRATIWRVSDRAALEESAQYEIAVTHHAVVDAADVYEAVGHGVRLLKRMGDGQNFWVLRVVEAGRRDRRGGYRYMRLSLTAFTPAEV